MEELISKLLEEHCIFLIAENKTQKVYKVPMSSYLPMYVGENGKKGFIIDGKEYSIDSNKVELGFKYALRDDFQTMWDIIDSSKHFKYNTRKDAENAYRIKFGEEPHNMDIEVRLDCIVVSQ